MSLFCCCMHAEEKTAETNDCNSKDLNFDIKFTD